MGSEKEQYRLEIGGYQGTAGDSLNDPWYGSNLRPFSTFDRYVLCIQQCNVTYVY